MDRHSFRSSLVLTFVIRCSYRGYWTKTFWSTSRSHNLDVLPLKISDKAHTITLSLAVVVISSLLLNHGLQGFQIHSLHSLDLSSVSEEDKCRKCLDFNQDIQKRWVQIILVDITNGSGWSASNLSLKAGLANFTGAAPSGAEGHDAAIGFVGVHKVGQFFLRRNFDKILIRKCRRHDSSACECGCGCGYWWCLIGLNRN